MIKIYKDLKQNTEEWLEVRLGKITGSGISKLFMGKGTGGHKNYLLSKSAEIITQMYSDESFSKSNIHIKRGHALEPEARLYYEMISNNTVEEVGFIELDEHTGCSPDGLIGDEGMVEIKSKDNHGFLNQVQNGESAIEKSYMQQIQFNLYVSNRQWCDYACYNPNFKEKPIYITRIKRSEKDIEETKAKLEEAIAEIKQNINNWKANISNSNNLIQPQFKVIENSASELKVVGGSYE